MQAIKYIEDPVDLLMRRRIQEWIGKQLLDKKEKTALLFDCHEFGFCHAMPFARSGDTPLFKFTWFRPAKRERLPSPRIVVTVTDTEGIWKNFRKRWSFALSKLGYLYCVAYEYQIGNGTKAGWVTKAWYRSWGKKKSHNLLDMSTAVPEDWVFREAERLMKKRR